MAALEAEGVWVKLGGRYVLKDVNLKLPPGKYWVKGPNGAGKTVLLKTLAFLIRPVKGVVRAYGKEDARGEVIYIHPNPVMLKGTVMENLEFGVKLRGKGDPLRAAESLGIEGLLNKRASQLSSGQKALVALARALAAEPKALLVDETLNYLDEENKRRALKALEEVETLLVASHFPLEGFVPLEVRDGRVLCREAER